MLGAVVRILSGFSAVEADHDDEIEQAEVAAVVHAVAVEQAPPSAQPSMPIGNRFVSTWPQEEPPRWMQTWHGSPAVMLLGNGLVTDARDFRTA